MDEDISFLLLSVKFRISCWVSDARRRSFWEI